MARRVLRFSARKNAIYDRRVDLVPFRTCGEEAIPRNRLARVKSLIIGDLAREVHAKELAGEPGPIVASHMILQRAKALFQEPVCPFYKPKKGG